MEFAIALLKRLAGEKKAREVQEKLLYRTPQPIH
jgi:hypothetical protein